MMKKTSKKQLMSFLMQSGGKLTLKQISQLASRLPGQEREFKTFKMVPGNFEGNQMSYKDRVDFSYFVPVNHYRRIKRLYKKEGIKGVFRYMYKFVQ